MVKNKARIPIGTVNAKVIGSQLNCESVALDCVSTTCSNIRRRQSVEFSFSGHESLVDIMSFYNGSGYDAPYSGLSNS